MGRNEVELKADRRVGLDVTRTDQERTSVNSVVTGSCGGQMPQDRGLQVETGRVVVGTVGHSTPTFVTTNVSW